MPRVLIVDDEAGNRALLRRLITRHLPVEVIEASNGLEALDALTKAPCDLLLLDARMPVLDGVETLEIVRQSPQLKDLPVCMMTVDRHEQLMQRAMALGISDFILKPINTETVTARIAQVLAGAGEDSGPPRRLTLEPRTRLVIVDEDAEFRTFFVRHVAARCNVTECASGLDALKACVRHLPDAIVIGPDTGMVSREALVKKVRTMSTGARTLCIGIVHHGHATRPPDGCDTVLVRSLDQAAFWTDFVRAVNADTLPPPASRT